MYDNVYIRWRKVKGPRGRAAVAGLRQSSEGVFRCLRGSEKPDGVPVEGPVEGKD
jgi:hypothetical protein